MTDLNKTEIIETNRTDIIEEQNEIIEASVTEIIENKKGPKGPHKVKRCPERWLENGKYNDKPIDPDYFIKYWRRTFQVPRTCPICNSNLQCSDKKKRHEQTKKCLKAKLLLETLTV